MTASARRRIASIANHIMPAHPNQSQPGNTIGTMNCSSLINNSFHRLHGEVPTHISVWSPAKDDSGKEYTDIIYEKASGEGIANVSIDLKLEIGQNTDKRKPVEEEAERGGLEAGGGPGGDGRTSGRLENDRRERAAGRLANEEEEEMKIEICPIPIERELKKGSSARRRIASIANHIMPAHPNQSQPGNTIGTMNCSSLINNSFHRLHGEVPTHISVWSPVNDDSGKEYADIIYEKASGEGIANVSIE
ncbi:unnamed protein product [Fraxinus pennsylvanica]|uniref:Uncharacterized protein n=1 Tax=Fraxinus pennsylvanica TaxID=56036 RepID=A0AAD1Z598_9LAMI|nr:unnamed protein product [Fraxinus pennsylvanica]